MDSKYNYTNEVDMNSFNPLIPTEISKLRQLAASATANTSVINLTVGHPLDAFPNELTPYLSQLPTLPLSYSANQGDLELRKLIAKKYGLFADEVCITNGAQGGLMNALMSVIENGKTKVALPNPGFLAYPTMVKMLGGEIVYYQYDVSTSKRFTLSVDALIQQIPNDCQVILINTPANPCAHEFSNDELKELARWAEAKKKFLILDEVYGELNYKEDYRPAEYANSYVFSISSLSKSHALAGARLGWILGKNSDWLKKSTVVNQYYNTCASSLAQQLAHFVFDETHADLHEKILRRYRNAYLEKLKLFYASFPQLEIPHSAFYGFLPIPSKFQDSESYAKHLLEKHSLLCVPGNYFGSEGEGFIRVALAVNDALIKTARDSLAVHYK
jgi:aspartate/methionine/tyrosine aminotransferase